MPGEELDDKELGKRLSAGRGYARESVAEFAERIKIGRADLAKMELGKFGSKLRPTSTDRKRRDAVERVRKATGLPETFFRIDFNDLDAMVETWERCKSGEEPPPPGSPRDLIPPKDR